MTENIVWRDWKTEPPAPGLKVVVLCDDGCSSCIGLSSEVMEGGKPVRMGLLDGEEGEYVPRLFLRDALWARIPDDYPVSFMEAADDRHERYW